MTDEHECACGRGDRPCPGPNGRPLCAPVQLVGIKCEMCEKALLSSGDCHVLEDFWDAPKYLADAIMCQECAEIHTEAMD